MSGCVGVFWVWLLFFFFFFFFNDTATTEIYTLSLHDALPISRAPGGGPPPIPRQPASMPPQQQSMPTRSEEHTSELQSPHALVCRLLLEKKKPSIAWASPMRRASPAIRAISWNDHV